MQTRCYAAIVIAAGMAFAPATISSQTEVPSRVRGFNTAQLLDWLNPDGTPANMPVDCPVATADTNGATAFGCAVAMIGASGSTLQRLVVFWSDLVPDQPTPSNTMEQQFAAGWRKYQAVIDALQRVGVTRMIIAPVGSPNWARPANRQTTPMTGFAKYAHPAIPGHLSDWKAFMTELARHVTPAGFEIGNEQNTNNFWDPIAATNQPPDPAKYAQLYCSAVDGIDAVSPTARVGIGGLAPIKATRLSGANGGDKVMAANQFVAESIDHGVGAAGCRLNFVAYHPYLTNDYCTAPASTPIASTNGIVELGRVRTSMVRHGHAAQKIWITEWGFPSRPYPHGGTTCTYSAAKQARLIALEHDYLARQPYTAFSGYFNLVDDNENNQNGSIGLVCSDFTVKPSFNTWRALRPAAGGSAFATGACGVPQL